MAAAAAEQGARRLRPDRRRHRPRHRRHLHLGRPLPERGQPGRRPARHRRRPARTTSTPPAPASRTRWPPPTTRSAPAPARNAIVIGAEKLSDVARLDRPQHLPSSSATAPAPRWSPRRRRRAAGIGPVVWGSAPEQGRRGRASRAGGRTSSRRARRSSAGPPPRSRRSRCRPASGPASSPTELAAFVPHQANLRIIDGIAKRLGAARRGRSPATSSSPATRRRRAIPLALSKLVERREVPSGAPGAAVRLRRRPHLRRAGRPLPVTPPHPGVRSP